MPYLYLSISTILVGVNVVVGKAVISVVPVFIFSALRFIIAAVVLVPMVFSSGEKKKDLFHLSISETIGLFLQAFTGTFLFSIFMLYGVARTSATSAGIIMSVTPAAIAILSLILLREKLTPYRIATIILAVIGVAFLNTKTIVESTNSYSAFGNYLVLAAVFSEALFIVYARKLSFSVSPLKMTLWVNLFGLILFLPFAWWEMTTYDLSQVTATTWSLVLYYSISASVLAFLFWYRGIAIVKANIAGLFTGLIPVSATIIAFFFLAEEFTIYHALGMGLVLAAILLGAKPDPDDKRFTT